MAGILICLFIILVTTLTSDYLVPQQLALYKEGEDQRKDTIIPALNLVISIRTAPDTTWKAKTKNYLRS